MSRRAIVLAMLWIVGCGSLPAPSIITRTRIVGARVTIEGDPSRAWPLPGERVTLSYLVLRADPSEPLVTSWSACVAGPAVSGIPTCAGDALAAVPAGPPSVEPPMFVIDVPDAATLGRSLGVLTLLASCAGGGSPVLDEASHDVACDAEPAGRGELSTFTIRVAPDLALANRHPSIAGETYALVG
nr:hypothetical protein [Myxococcota bacterium]